VPSTTQVVPLGKILLFLDFLMSWEAAQIPAVLKIAIDKAAKSHAPEEFKPSLNNLHLCRAAQVGMGFNT